MEDGVQLSLTSPDGDQGYPGEVQVSVSYTLQVNTPSILYSSVVDHHWNILYIFLIIWSGWRVLAHESICLMFNERNQTTFGKHPGVNKGPETVNIDSNMCHKHRKRNPFFPWGNLSCTLQNARLRWLSVVKLFHWILIIVSEWKRNISIVL